MPDSPGLNKQLFHMDLSGGIDERSRPELMPSNVSITDLVNLVQNQTASWVKREGTVALSVLDNEGSPIGVPKALFRSIDSGLCMVAAGGQLYHYQENQATWRKINTAPEFSVEANFVGSTQAADVTNQAVISTASNRKYDLVVYIVAGTAAPVMVVYDRASQLEAAKYDLKSEFGAGDAKIVFVNDRYLHIWSRGEGNDLKVTQIDTLNLEWPDDLSGYTPFIIDSFGGGMNDVTASDVSSYVASTNFDDSVGKINGHSTSGSDDATADLDFYPTGIDLDNAGNLWAAGFDVASNKLAAQAFDPSDLTTTTHARWVDSSVSPMNISMAAYGDGRICVSDFGSETFGGTTIDYIKVYQTASASSITVTLKAKLSGWIPSSTPYRFTVITDKIYQQVHKQDIATLSANCVVCLTDHIDTVWTDDPFTSSSVRLAAMLEPNNALSSTNGLTHPMPWNDDDNISHVSHVVAHQVTARSVAYGVYMLSSPDPKQYNACRFGSGTALACGVMSNYDGSRCVELGFADMPRTDLQETVTSGNPDGEYVYLTVFKHVNAFGEVTYSRGYGPLLIEVTAHKVAVTVQPVSVTNKEGEFVIDQKVITEVYRTKAGQTQFFLCASTQPGSGQQLILNATNGFFEVDDNLADTDLQSKPILYRQPGTANAAVDRFPFNPSRSVCQHKDRIFIIDQFGLNIRYSSFFVDGETAWTNPEFGIRVHGGSGPITALASMDNRLFVFKRDGVWVIDGDGPPENGGTGAEFSTPQLLATAFGCIDPRSLVVTPIGIMYQSKRGIEVLDHSLHVGWIGSRVQNTTSAYPICSGATVSADNRRVRFYLTTAEPGLITGVDGLTLVFDIEGAAWSKELYKNNLGSVTPVQSVCLANVLGVERTVTCDDSEVKMLDSDSGQDDFGSTSIYYTPSKLETGWIRVSAPQARQRIYDIVCLFRKAAGNHAVKFSLAFDYSDTYTQELTFEPDVINDALFEELLIQPEQQDVTAIRLKIEDQAPADTTRFPVGAGKGFELLDITYNMAPKAGPPKLSVVQKG